MARGNSTRRNLSPEEISELLKGNPAALQKQAQKGGNAPKAAPANPAANPAAQPAPAPTTPQPSAGTPPPLPPPLPNKKEEEGKKEKAPTPWWAQKNNGILRKMLFGGNGKGDINEASTDYGAQQEMQELINKTRRKLGLKPGQPLPLPPGASVPAGVSITGGK